MFNGFFKKIRNIEGKIFSLIATRICKALENRQDYPVLVYLYCLKINKSYITLIMKSFKRK